MKIWILAISHEHGNNYSAHVSKKIARATLADWCRDFWDQNRPAPDGNNDVIREYFEYTAAIGASEWAEITKIKLKLK